ncbi:hypothetical protein J3Q64DRAFT_1705400 [Phycomyces blakesleeanus]|uniref:Uncharacterized protein n=1 Tax=Phycomyces blakesleeanus TaxID=4837 RepID=A0ABR3BAP1_PHYBL
MKDIHIHIHIFDFFFLFLFLLFTKYLYHSTTPFLSYILFNLFITIIIIITTISYFYLLCACNNK